MSNKKLNDTEKAINALLEEVKELKKIMKLTSVDINILKENSNMVLAKVSDLSCKIDLDISTLNIQNGNTIKKSAPAKVSSNKDDILERKLNIMTFFKAKFKDDFDSLKNIITKDEIDKLFKEHQFEIDGKAKKKDVLDKFKAGLVYKELIKPNDDKMKKLRSLKEREESEKSKLEPEINESIYDIEEDVIPDVVNDDDINEAEIDDDDSD
jgi:hypothetical protein